MSVQFSFCKFRTRIFAEGESGDDNEVMHHGQLYCQVVFQNNRTRKTLCLRGLFSFGSQPYFEVVVDRDVEAMSCKDIVILDEHVLYV